MKVHRFKLSGGEAITLNDAQLYALHQAMWWKYRRNCYENPLLRLRRWRKDRPAWGV